MLYSYIIMKDQIRMHKNSSGREIKTTASGSVLSAPRPAHPPDHAYSPLQDHAMEEYNDLTFSDNWETLRGMLVQCGHKCVTAHSYVMDGMTCGLQEMAIWIYTLAGEGELCIDGHISRISSGKAMLLMRPEAHRYQLPADSKSWEFIYVGVCGAELLRILGEFRLRHGSVCIFSDDSRATDAAWSLLHDCRNHLLNDSYSASAAAYNFVMALCASAGDVCDGRGISMLRTIREYCLARLDRPITVAELSEAAGCSRWHFARRFQELSGCSPHEFIINLKMRKAVRMLATRSSVKEIAYACGFENVGYFCRVFRKTYGVSPGMFRRGKVMPARGMAI